jgi:hypothetical protein
MTNLVEKRVRVLLALLESVGVLSLLLLLLSEVVLYMSSRSRTKGSERGKKGSGEEKKKKAGRFGRR